MISSPSITYKLHILTLSAFAFAQPLYDLLGKNAEFFPVRNNESTDILLLIVLLSVLLPAALAGIVEAGRIFGRRLWEILHLCLITLLVTIITLPALKNIPAISTAFTYIFASLIGIAFAYFYLKKGAMRLFLTYLSPASLIFPVLFIFNSQVSHLLFQAEPPELEATNIKSKTPIVMIIFDELPVSTLMSEKYQIDRNLFPGFASLAATSTWYPNTATVAEYTVQAIPAILTGNLPSGNSGADIPKHNLEDWLDIPSYRSHPRNLFTALGSNYDLRVFETVSSLCPESLCIHSQDHKEPLKQRLAELCSDLFIVYLHIVLPKDAASRIPRIDMNWADFVGNNFDNIHHEIKSDDVNRFEHFIRSLTPSNKPALYFHHSTFPHNPWKYLPSGNEYDLLDYSHALSTELVWMNDADLREPYQRHLLQTMYADRLLGEALGKLKTEGIYDEAIIIVTSDHGASFKHNESFRSVSQNNYADIMDIPLFVKYPKQYTASIDTTRLQSIDIIHVLFSAIGEAFPWKTDGNASIVASTNTKRQLPVFPKKGTVKYINHDPERKFDTVAWKKTLFGNTGIRGIYGGPDHAHLIGQSINKECSKELTDITVFGQGENIISIDPSSGKINSLVKIMTPEKPPTQTDLVAVIVNNEIAAILPEYSLSRNTEYFYTMIHEKPLKSGINHVSISRLHTPEKCYDYALSGLQ